MPSSRPSRNSTQQELAATVPSSMRSSLRKGLRHYCDAHTCFDPDFACSMQAAVSVWPHSLSWKRCGRGILITRALMHSISRPRCCNDLRKNWKPAELLECSLGKPTYSLLKRCRLRGPTLILSASMLEYLPKPDLP